MKIGFDMEQGKELAQKKLDGFVDEVAKGFKGDAEVEFLKTDDFYQELIKEYEDKINEAFLDERFEEMFNYMKELILHYEDMRSLLEEK